VRVGSGVFFALFLLLVGIFFPPQHLTSRHSIQPLRDHLPQTPPKAIRVPKTALLAAYKCRVLHSLRHPGWERRNSTAIIVFLSDFFLKKKKKKKRIDTHWTGLASFAQIFKPREHGIDATVDVPSCTSSTPALSNRISSEPASQRAPSFAFSPSFPGMPPNAGRFC
jgi:hypothetical protein